MATYKTRYELFAFCLALICFAWPAYACICSIASIEKRYEEMPVIFLGEAMQIKVNEYYWGTLPNGERIGGPKRIQTTFRVLKQWKGIDRLFVDIQSDPNDANCGYSFKRQNKYLVFAYVDKEASGLKTGLCTGTRPAQNSKADIEKLNAFLKNSK